MTDTALKRLTGVSAILGCLPEHPDYNGSVLLIDDEEAARCVADIDAAIVEILEAAEHIRLLEKGLKDAHGDAEQLAVDIDTISLWHRGSPSYEHDGFFIRRKAVDVVRKHFGLGPKLE